MRRWRAVVLDLDGTLVDSSSCVVRCAVDALAGEGRRVEGDAAALIGLPLAEMLARLAPGIDDRSLARAVERYRQAYIARAEAEEALFEGIEDLLAALVGAGLRLAIATGKSHAGALAAAGRHGLERHVEAVHGIVPGTPGKPHPAVLQRALAQLRVPADEAVVVGDTTYDLLMARAGGAAACGVTWGVHRRDRLAEARPDGLVDTLPALRAWLMAGRA